MSNTIKKAIHAKRTALYLINQSSYCSITRSGWHLPGPGVAAASQILCISTALNKRKSICIKLYCSCSKGNLTPSWNLIKTLHCIAVNVKIQMHRNHRKSLCKFWNTENLPPASFLHTMVSEAGLHCRAVQLTFKTNFWISFSLDAFSMMPPMRPPRCSWP